MNAGTIVLLAVSIFSILYIIDYTQAMKKNSKETNRLLTKILEAQEEHLRRTEK